MSGANDALPSPTAAEMEALADLCRTGRFADATVQGEALAVRTALTADLANLIGVAHAGLRRFDAAIRWYRRALDQQPDAAGVLTNLAAAHRGLGDSDAAIDYCRRVLALQPDNADAHNNLGNALHDRGEGEAALAAFRRAAVLRPDRVVSHYNYANMAHEIGRPDEAIAAYGRALRILPGFAPARAQRLHQFAQICDWDAIEEEAALIPTLGIDGGSVSPFTLLALDDDPARNRQRAEIYTAEMVGTPERHVFRPPTTRPERLKIGYFSADFHDHATLRLMAGLFERHDHDRFEIQAYSYGPHRDDAMRQRLRAALDGFQDVRALSDAAVAELARGDGIDIAVDLKGLTYGARPGIFACGAAPVQIGYLGYPGTLGAPFLDYLIADRVVIPAMERAHYAENILYLRHSYQVNDDRRPIAEATPSRADMGLPENGFVFCCFNNGYKITPDAFDVWMRLLAQVDGSVLWLLSLNEQMVDNLRHEARRRGIASDRLVFGPPLPPAEHLARYRLADLFLDSFHYNAHTTASDALWAGLPVLTLAGRGFPARVGASLLGAIGLPELITTSIEDYAACALDLATDPAKLAAIRKKLAANRRRRPLFRTDLSTAQIERAYEAAHARWRAGQAPADIDVEDVAPLRLPSGGSNEAGENFRR